MTTNFLLSLVVEPAVLVAQLLWKRYRDGLVRNLHDQSSQIVRIGSSHELLSIIYHVH